MSHKVEQIVNAIIGMRHNPLRNYVVPGLHSYLIGGPNGAKVRELHAERETFEFVTPHSHRYDFTCLVLSGEVENRIFTLSKEGQAGAETWIASRLSQVSDANGLMGGYTKTTAEQPSYWTNQLFYYRTGDVYSMTHHQIHSIRFHKDTHVLFFESPPQQFASDLLEPWVNGKHIPTFRVESWMFERESE